MPGCSLCRGEGHPEVRCSHYRGCVQKACSPSVKMAGQTRCPECGSNAVEEDTHYSQSHMVCTECGFLLTEGLLTTTRTEETFLQAVNYTQSTAAAKMPCRNKVQGMRRVRDLCQILRLRPVVQDTAMELYVRAYDHDEFLHVTLEKKEALVGCCIHIACRQHNWPLTMGTLYSLLHVEATLFSTVYLQLVKELQLDIPTLSLKDLVTTHCNGFHDLTKDLVDQAGTLSLRGLPPWWKRGRRWGGGGGKFEARLKRRGMRLSLPGILLANMQLLENKIENLRTRLMHQREMRDCCVLCLNEAWLSPSTLDTAIRPEGFSIYRMDQTADLEKAKGGGVCFMIKLSVMLQHGSFGELVSPDLEHLMVKSYPFYLPKEFSSIILTAVYTSPVADYNQVLEILHDTVSRQGPS
ncbi:uncharacterized protein LOC132392949 isoform X2 [Hypanus sabinus]|uniref:uncharacterized protein LOC132392949 isoform X2 n=1 Tax=Hypanus sabinus TaxID=79690 RepID=UPI0028C4F5E4|nr:uncharacterized protein LOC132392949 isoform X2 [Hypanus sabinus]